MSLYNFINLSNYVSRNATIDIAKNEGRVCRTDSRTSLNELVGDLLIILVLLY